MSMADRASNRPRLAAQIAGEVAGGGRPLDVGLRRCLEASFDIDLGAIRVHDDTRAGHLVRAVRADAFTAGTHLFFRQGAFRPQAERGMWLLAHEVAHAIQQAVGAATDHRGSHTSERLADRAADRVVAGLSVERPAGLDAIPEHSGRQLVIQRHASWEHRLLGDTPATDLDSIVKNDAKRTEILKGLYQYLLMWQNNPTVDPAQINSHYSYIRTMTLKGSGLPVTYGELNTLPDYLADAGSMDSLPRAILEPILQAVRQEGFYNVVKLLGYDIPFVKFTGAITTHLFNGTINDIWESIWLDDLTANLPVGAAVSREGTDNYSALLARNACHFAPYSWYRWGQSYDTAVSKALEAHGSGNADVAREAWVHLGYADHFLQDSFAAGHLVNKTLVMQWFVDWAAGQPLERVPDWVEVQTMTAARQPGLSAGGLYSPANPGGVRDPQTAEEQDSEAKRMAMTGVQADGDISQEAAYQNYLTFLNSSVVQASTLELHDLLNTSGLFVASEDHLAPFQVFGDNTMLNGGDGVAIARDTAAMSEQSIQDLLDNGTTPLSKDVIRRRFPTMARPETGDTMLPLKEWNASMRDKANLAFGKVHDLAVGTFKPRMGHVSQDLALFNIKLTCRGRSGYLARGTRDWAQLTDQDSAARLRVRIYDNNTFFGTEDDWWLSVGTTGVRNGGVGFYYWRNAGWPNWSYDPTTKRLTSALFPTAPMGLQRGADNFIYCWQDYDVADVELEYL